VTKKIDEVATNAISVLKTGGRIDEEGGLGRVM